jgi:hypothetical protein
MKQKMLSELKKGDVVFCEGYSMDMDFHVTEIKVTKAGRIRVYGRKIWTNKKTGEIIESSSDIFRLHNGAVADTTVPVK